MCGFEELLFREGGLLVVSAGRPRGVGSRPRAERMVLA